MLDETKLVGLLEALYAFELDDRDWLSRSLAALADICGPDYHYIGFFYDASNVHDFKVWNPCAVNATPEVLASFETFRTLTTPDFVRATFRSLHMGSSLRTGVPYLEPLLAERARGGWGDIFNINGLDPSGVSCILTIGCREPEFVLDPASQKLYRRVSHHLGAAFRCRRRLGVSSGRADDELKRVAVSNGAEAIPDGNGRFVHAEGAAESTTARERIKSAAATIDTLRTNQKRRQGREALALWHPLTAARWTIVDHFEENGRRYIVARENQVDAQGFELLTDRERQVVVQAALGCSNKEIAYALGISEATVRVLMARAASRLGVRTKKRLLEHPALGSIRTEETRSAASPPPNRND